MSGRTDRSAEDPRRKRLRSEWGRLQQMHQETDHVAAKPLVNLEGAIADRYEITFRCRGIAGIEPGTKAPIYANEHRMEIYCGAEFPDRPPKLTWLTDIYHPNISRSLGVCTNAEEWLAGMGLDEICFQVFEMVQYRNYFIDNEKPYPLDWDAAAWVRDYAEPKGIVSRTKGVDDTPFYKASASRAIRIKRLGPQPQASSEPAPVAGQAAVAEAREPRRIRIGPRREEIKPAARGIRVRS
jgi:ubiquitin-protein ligase